MIQALTAVFRTPPEQITSEETPPRTIVELPQEIWLKVFSEFSASEASKASSVCWEWNHLLNDDVLWKFFWQRDFNGRDPSSKVETTQENFKTRYILYSTLINGLCVRHPPIQHRKKVSSIVYGDESLFSGALDTTIKIWNAATGVCLTISDDQYSGRYGFEDRRSDTFTSLVYANKKIISGSLDSTIKIWNTRRRCYLNTLNGHTGMVKSLVYADELLFSGSRDTTIKIWNTKTAECINTLNGHTNLVKFLIYADGQLISGSFDHSIKIWNTETGVCRHTLNGHADRITSLIYTDGLLISGSLDTTIKIWDTKTGACSLTLSGHTDRISALVYVGGKLFSSSFDKTIKVWDPLTGTCLKTLEGHTDKVTSLVYADGVLISGSFDRTIKIWDPTTGDCTHTLEGHTGAVKSLLYADRLLFSDSCDKTVRVWDFRYPRLASSDNSAWKWSSCVIS